MCLLHSFKCICEFLMINNEYFKIANCRLDTKLSYIREVVDKLANKYNFSVSNLRTIKDKIIDKEEEILVFGETRRIEYEKNKLCRELTKNKLFELKTIRDLNKSIDKITQNTTISSNKS